MPRGIPNKPAKTITEPITDLVSEIVTDDFPQEPEEVKPVKKVDGISLETITDLVFLTQNGERVHLDYFRGADTFILRPL